jgi:hypothetical protein
VVEWGEAVAPAYQPTVVISISGQDDDRQFEVELPRDGAAARAETWAANLSAHAS